MNTFQLACFVEVAATLNFSIAARNLNVSQPAVSHNIKALEDELGCALVSRSTRSVTLTEEGLKYLSCAQDMLDLAEHGKRLVSRSRASDTVFLRIGAHGGVESMAISPVLREFHECMPDVILDIRSNAPHSALINMLESGTIDVLLEYRSPQGAPSGATVFRRLVDAPTACWCSSGHPLAGRSVIDIADLHEAGTIAVPNPHASLAAIDSLQRCVLSHVDVQHVMPCSSPETALALVAAGVACAVLPSVPDLSEYGIRAVPVKGLPNIAFGVRVRRGKMSRQVEEFVRLLGESTSDLAGC